MGDLFSMERDLVRQSFVEGCFFHVDSRMGKITTNDNLRIRGIILLDCVAYVGRVGKWWIIFYFNLILQMQRGAMFFMLGCLEFIG